MCALFALKFSTSDIVADFEMKTNDHNYGCFDDVVLTVTFVDGQSQMFLLQLKHSEKKKTVNASKLAADNNDFSLSKYIESIPKIKITKNTSFILYTNSKTSIKSDIEIILQIENMTNEGTKNKDNKNKSKKNENKKIEGKKVVVRELPELDLEKLLLTNRDEISNKTEGTKVFQFELSQSCGSDEGLDNHLKHFYFFAHQINTTRAELLIKAMLKKKCGINNATSSSNFIPFMKKWWSGNFILSKYDVIAKLVELTLAPFIKTISDKKCKEEKEEKSKLLREAIMKFDMTIVRDTNEKIVANIWNETASDKEISLILLKYYGSCVQGIKDLSSEEISKVLWHLNKVPLIVRAEKCHKAQVKDAIGLLERIEKKKVILLANATKKDFPGWKILQDLSDLSNEPVYTDITKHFAVSLQGRPSISLDQLLNFDKKNAKMIETTELIKMTQEVVQIGRRQEKAFENYIPRSVSTISLDINKLSEFCKKTNSLLIICNVSPSWNEAIGQLNLHVMELDQNFNQEEGKELSKLDLLLTGDNWPEVRFDEICERTTRKNVHLLQVFDKKNYCTSVLSKPDRFSLEIIKSERARIDEMEIFTYLDHPLNVICSPPGMGKSTLVTRLSSICPSSYWSVRVNLINHKTVFKNECAHDQILRHFVEEEKDPLVVKIRTVLLQNKRMYFFLDGLDEIDSDCLKIAFDFIQNISSLGHRVWITSRDNLEQTVSRSLDIFPIKIEELAEKEQKTYIQKRLQNIYQKDEVEQITNKIYASVDIVNSRHLLGVPLQLFMVTENFRDNKDLWRQPDQEIFVLTKMYKIFFQGKKKHQHRKLGVHEHEDQLGFDVDLYLEQYELPALKSCLDSVTFDKLNVNLRRSQMFLEKLKTGDPIGIVSGVTDDNQIIFNHQTYAEYFACAWLKNNLDKVSLLQDDLFTKKNQNLRLIFDIMLAENSVIHLAVIYRDTDLVSKHLDKSEVKDESGRSPLQLLCTYGVEHWRLRKATGDMKQEFYLSNKIEGVSTQYRQIFKMLSHCDVFQTHDLFQKDHIFQWNCLDFAIRLQNLFAVEKIVERFGDSISLERLSQRSDIGTLAIYSSQMGYPNLLRAVIKKDSKALSVKIGMFCDTLLHVAVEGIKVNKKFGQILMEERKKVITTLIECGLDVDEPSGFKKTALHLASELDGYAIVNFLLHLGANINLTDNVGYNALHYVLRNSNSTEIVKLLIDRGIDVEGRDCDGRTPLHLCCREGHHDGLVILLEKGANINAKDSMNQTPLYEAILRHNYDCVKMILDHGADINAVNNSGETVLHAAVGAVEGSNYHCIEMLLDHRADINAVNNSGKTVLHAAVGAIDGTNYNCIKMLLDKGADINAVDNSGKTVLHAALEDPDYLPEVEVIQLLLGRGVDANKRDKEQKTALDYAAIRHGSHFPVLSVYQHIVKILFDATARDQLTSTDYVTSLHYAVYDGNCVAVELFLESGLDLNNIDANNGEYPLNFAVENELLRSDLLLKMTKFIQDHKTDLENDEIF
jgi:ankyrin repeat protein